MIHIRITEEARQDLVEGYAFYELQESGAGEYSASCLKGDIASLHITAGIHRASLSFQRMFSRVFPYAIFYHFSENVVAIIAVIDTRRDPKWIRNRLKR